MLAQSFMEEVKLVSTSVRLLGFQILHFTIHRILIFKSLSQFHLRFIWKMGMIITFMPEGYYKIK